MVIEALDKLYPKALKEKYRKVMTINCSENDLIDIMKKYLNILIFLLPKIINEDRKSLISISGYNKEEG